MSLVHIKLKCTSLLELSSDKKTMNYSTPFANDKPCIFQVFFLFLTLLPGKVFKLYELKISLKMILEFLKELKPAQKGARFSKMC